MTFQDDGHLAGVSEMLYHRAKIRKITTMFHLILSKITCTISLHCSWFQQYYAKAELKTDVTSTKVYLRPPDFFSIS